MTAPEIHVPEGVLERFNEFLVERTGLSPNEPLFAEALTAALEQLVGELSTDEVAIVAMQAANECRSEWRNERFQVGLKAALQHVLGGSEQ